jgi:hypothetical protein
VSTGVREYGESMYERLCTEVREYICTSGKL